MKRYSITGTDGKNETMNEEMFDFNVLVFLNRITRRPPSSLYAWASVYQVARAMYARPTVRTFDSVRASLLRSHDAGHVKRDGDYFQMGRRK